MRADLVVNAGCVNGRLFNNNVCVPCLVALAAGYTNVIIYYWYLRCVVLQVCLCECLLTVYKKTNFADMFKKQEQT